MTPSHRPIYPPPAGPAGPHIAVAFVPAGIVVAGSFLGTRFGELIPTNATLAMLEFGTPVAVLIVTGLTGLIAARCEVSMIGLDIVLKLAVTVIAALVSWFAAPGFISYGLPAIIADRSDSAPTTHVVEVLAATPVCGRTRGGVRSALYGAVVRSDLLGGPSGSTICRIPPAVWRGLRPGDQLTLHGRLGRFAFHYDRITR